MGLALKRLIGKLQTDKKLFNQYDKIIQDQIKDGIVEIVPKDSQGIAFYLPHRSLIFENAESKKVQIVHSGSVKASNFKISLNNRLEKGLPLQNKIWDILFRKKFEPIALSADMEMAFSQFRIRKSGRD